MSCTKENKAVKKGEPCCEGLKPVFDGESYICQEVKEKEVEESQNIFTGYMFWLGITVPFMLLLFVSLSVKKKIK